MQPAGLTVGSGERKVSSPQKHAGSLSSPGTDMSRSTSRLRRRRRLLFAAGSLAVIVALAVAGVAWLGFKASTISSELNAANQLVTRLRDEVIQDDPKAATTTVKALQKHTTKAREAADDPLWTVAGALPWVGANFQATREVATSADDVVQLGVVPLVGVSKTLDWKSLMPDGNGIDLGPLAAAEPKLASAAQAIRQSSDRLNGINAEALVPQISTPLVRVREQLNSVRDGLDTAADAARILPGMMGEQAPRRYLLLIQNNAELRATGGIPGALAVMNVDDGKLSLSSQTSATAMGSFSPIVSVDAEQTQIYSARLGKFMQDVNLTPDFPTAAKTAQSMWKRKTGEQLDGVLSMDPVALSYILNATGPVRMSNPLLQEFARSDLPVALTAKNVVPTLLSDVYSKIPEPDMQDAYFADVAQEVFSKVSTGSSDTKKLIEGVTRAASERRVLLWSSTTGEESIISQYPLGGSITGAAISPSQFGVYFNDGTGAKMDYHVKRTVQLIQECPSGGYAQVKVRITSSNTAPKDAATSLPEYVTGGGTFGTPAGNVQTNIVVYGPVQSTVEAAVIDSKKAGFSSQQHSSRPVGSTTVSLAPGQTSTVEFTFGKIVQHTPPKLAVTPTVQPLKDVALNTTSERCAPAA